MKQYPDDLIRGFDRALRTLTGQHRANRPSPAADEPQNADLSAEEVRHAAGLMRVNHCGEVCAQALYDGQSTTARSPEVLAVLAHAGEEEVDHLVWCEERLDELGSRPSVLNPLFYGASWTLGAVAGLLGDRVSLAFVEATEDQVVKHLDSHLSSLPDADERSRAVVTQMREDEARHGHDALELAGTLGDGSAAPVEEQTLSPLQKRVMAGVARLMTATTYRI